MKPTTGHPGAIAALFAPAGTLPGDSALFAPLTFLAHQSQNGRLGGRAGFKEAVKKCHSKPAREKQRLAATKQHRREKPTLPAKPQSTHRPRRKDGLGKKASIDPTTVYEIIKSVASKHGLTPEDLTGDCRKAPLVRARFEAIAQVRSQLRMGLAMIGFHFGFRDHSTIKHALDATGVR